MSLLYGFVSFKLYLNIQTLRDNAGRKLYDKKVVYLWDFFWKFSDISVGTL